MPQWTREACEAAPALDVPALRSYFEGRFGGKTPDGVAWAGSIMVGMQVLSVIDALVVSCVAPVPVDVEVARRFFRLMPAPGGALDRLAVHAWAFGCALVRELARCVPGAPDAAWDWEAVRDALGDVDGLPAWDLGRWGGNVSEPPRNDAGEIAYLLGGARPAKLVRWVQARAGSIRAPLSVTDRRVLPRWWSRWSVLGDGSGALAHRVGRLVAYQRVAGDAWQLPLVLLRLLAHLRFGAATVCGGAGRTWGGMDVGGYRPRLEQLAWQLCALEELDQLLLHNLLFHSRARLDIDPLDLLAGERWLATVWDHYASMAFGVAWGAAPAIGRAARGSGGSSGGGDE